MFIGQMTSDSWLSIYSLAISSDVINDNVFPAVNSKLFIKVDHGINRLIDFLIVFDDSDDVGHTFFPFRLLLLLFNTTSYSSIMSSYIIHKRSIFYNLDRIIFICYSNDMNETQTHLKLVAMPTDTEGLQYAFELRDPALPVYSSKASEIGHTLLNGLKDYAGDVAGNFKQAGRELSIEARTALFDKLHGTDFLAQRRAEQERLRREQFAKSIGLLELKKTTIN